jgi:hypothetical protein
MSNLVREVQGILDERKVAIEVVIRLKLEPELLGAKIFSAVLGTSPKTCKAAELKSAKTPSQFAFLGQ